MLERLADVCEEQGTQKRGDRTPQGGETRCRRNQSHQTKDLAQ
jgi:hypothetical protein